MLNLSDIQHVKRKLKKPVHSFFWFEQSTVCVSRVQHAQV